MRRLLLVALTVPGLLATPSQATPAALHFTVEFGCLGCGWTQVQIDGACAGICNGVNCAGCFMSGSGEAYTSLGSCAAEGWMSGDLQVGQYAEPFILSWSGPLWSMTRGGNTAGSGVLTIGPCEGGAGEATFSGFLTFAPP